jgi:hypothetical protein
MHITMNPNTGLLLESVEIVAAQYLTGTYYEHRHICINLADEIRIKRQWLFDTAE